MRFMSHFLAESAAFIIASVGKRPRTRDKIEREKKWSVSEVIELKQGKQRVSVLLEM